MSTARSAGGPEIGPHKSVFFARLMFKSTMFMTHFCSNGRNVSKAAREIRKAGMRKGMSMSRRMMSYLCVM